MSEQAPSWLDLEDEFCGTTDDPSGTLLLGNGFSINLWSAFRYDALLDEAPLSDEALAVFGHRKDFEVVLSDLAAASHVVDSIAPQDPMVDNIDNILHEVREGLLHAVEAVHPPARRLETGLKRTKTQSIQTFTGVGTPVRPVLGAELRRHRRIFTTNYDLLTYWPAVDAQIADLFTSSKPFDLAKARGWLQSTPTALIFVHGALHLVRSRATGAERKLLAADSGDLLGAIRDALQDPDLAPVFISEGSSTEKIASIRRSPYLSFALEALQDSNEPLTVLGHSLSDRDQHISDALERHPRRPIAIGVYVPQGNDPEDALRVERTRLRGRLPHCRNVEVFDSSEHPLTARTLNCGP